MLTIQDIKNAIGNGCPRFASFTYTSKKHGETARYTLLLNASYTELCQKDITELEIQLASATGIRKVVIEGMIASLRESINAKNEGREHVNYTKAGLYEWICPGVKMFTEDGTLEFQGMQVAKKVIVPGFYKEVKHRSEETAIKAEMRKGLKTGQIKTLCLDLGNMHFAKINGETLDFE